MGTPAQRLAALTKREAEVLALMADGRSNKEISDIQGVTVATARNQTVAVMLKLDSASRGEAARIWWQAKVDALMSRIAELEGPGRMGVAV